MSQNHYMVVNVITKHHRHHNVAEMILLSPQPPDSSHKLTNNQHTTHHRSFSCHTAPNLNTGVPTTLSGFYKVILRASTQTADRIAASDMLSQFLSMNDQIFPFPPMSQSPRTKGLQQTNAYSIPPHPTNHNVPPISLRKQQPHETNWCCIHNTTLRHSFNLDTAIA